MTAIGERVFDSARRGEPKEDTAEKQEDVAEKCGLGTSESEHANVR